MCSGNSIESGSDDAGSGSGGGGQAGTSPPNSRIRAPRKPVGGLAAGWYPRRQRTLRSGFRSGVVEWLQRSQRVAPIDQVAPHFGQVCVGRGVLKRKLLNSSTWNEWASAGCRTPSPGSAQQRGFARGFSGAAESN
jgi:hypothetical protein